MKELSQIRFLIILVLILTTVAYASVDRPVGYFIAAVTSLLSAVFAVQFSREDL